MAPTTLRITGGKRRILKGARRARKQAYLRSQWQGCYLG
jgi:hypothetical protein